MISIFKMVGRRASAIAAYERETETRARETCLGGVTFQTRLDHALEEIRTMLLAKNASYGNSALDPVRLFSSADPVEQIKVRIDDKVSRLVRGHEAFDDNTPDDMLGYLVLLWIARTIEREKA